MQAIPVVAGILVRNGQIMISRRPAGAHMGMKWEFPGGKIEPGETPEQALVREIREELSATVEPLRLLHTIEYDYPAFHLSMDCFACVLRGGEPTLREALAARWLGEDELETVDWLPADRVLLPTLRELLAGLRREGFYD